MSSDRRSSDNTHLSGREKTHAVLRLLNGEPVEKISEESGVSVRRLERWKSDFVTAGSAELGRRRDLPKRGWFGRHSGAIKHWIFFLITLVIVISAMVYLQNRPE